MPPHRDLAAFDERARHYEEGWRGRLHLELSAAPGDGTALRFTHVGLVPAAGCHDLCANGWDHYLRSLAAYASGGTASPWHPGIGGAPPGAAAP